MSKLTITKRIKTNNYEIKINNTIIFQQLESSENNIIKKLMKKRILQSLNITKEKVLNKKNLMHLFTIMLCDNSS